MKKYNHTCFILILNFIFYSLISSKHITARPTITDEKTILQLYQLMKDTHEVLQMHNIPYWIAAGTLLGAVRHQGIIPWDDDLDIRVDKELKNDFNELKQTFKQLGYAMIDRPNGYRICLQNKNEINGQIKIHHYPFMDVCFYKQKGNNIYYNWNKIKQPRQDEGVFIYANELFPLRLYKFGKFYVSGPNNPLPYLICCYGKECLNVASYGHSHFHFNGKNKNKGRIILTPKDTVPAMPTGPLKNRVEKIQKNNNFTVETIQITKNNLIETEKIFVKLLPIFTEAFKHQTEIQLREEHAQEYESFKNSGIMINDLLRKRFNKILETLLLQLEMVSNTYISIIKNTNNIPVGYVIFIQAPINTIIQSMIDREYIESIIQISDKTLDNSNNNDLYITSIAIYPKYQNQGLGKRLISTMLTQVPEAKNIYLLTAESKTNLNVQKFYEHLTFENKGLFLTSDKNKKILYCLDIKNLYW
jgi:phosphorylcholine metabolism protein LicD/ribosomal protein S18 acetylase RimI-like enzyme